MNAINFLEGRILAHETSKRYNANPESDRELDIRIAELNYILKKTKEGDVLWHR